VWSLLPLTGCGIGLPDPAARLVAFGDSATAGPDQPGYPEQLADLLGDARLVANAGMGGESTFEGLDRLGLILQFETFPNAVGLLYWEGGNDVIEFLRGHDPLLVLSPGSPDFPFSTELSDRLDEVQANIERAIEMGHDAGWTVLVVTYYPFAPGGTACPALPLGVLTADQSEIADEYALLLNERIRRAAGAAGAKVVAVDELGETLVADDSNYFNCNHLSASGNGLVARLVADAVMGDDRLSGLIVQNASEAKAGAAGP